MSETPETPETESGDPSDKKITKRLTPSEWAQVVTLWELGRATLSELSRLFGISVAALRKGLKNRGAVRGIRAHEIGNSAVEAAKSDVQKNIERISTMKERFIGYTDLVAKLTMKELTEAVRDKTPLATKRNDLQTLQRAANILATLRSESYHLYGLNDENPMDEELPEIGITEYTSEEIAKMQRGFDQVDDTLEGYVDEIDLHLPFEDLDDGDD